MTNEQCSNHNSDNKKTRVDSNYAQIEGIQKNTIFSMATYSPEVTLVRSTVVKGAPEITPGDRVTRDMMRVALNDKPGTCSKHEAKLNGTTKKEEEGYSF